MHFSSLAHLASPPPPVTDPGGVPMGVWANLPLLVCGSFLLVGIVGIFFILRENRRQNLRRMAEETDFSAEQDT